MNCRKWRAGNEKRRARATKAANARWAKYHAALACDPPRKEGPSIPVQIGTGPAAMRFEVRRPAHRTRKLEAVQDGRVIGRFSARRIGMAVSRYAEAWA